MLRERTDDELELGESSRMTSLPGKPLWGGTKALDLPCDTSGFEAVDGGPAHSK